MCEGDLEKSKLLKIRIKKKKQLYPQTTTTKTQKPFEFDSFHIPRVVHIFGSIFCRRGVTSFLSSPSINRIYLACCRLPQEKFKIPNWCDSETYHLSQECVPTSDTQKRLFKAFSEI